MVVALSRFRVARGTEAAVAAALHNRPHLVEAAPGFLGIEMFTAGASEFVLLTRWRDRESFERWHHSPAHDASHPAVPKGIEPSFARLELLEAIEEPVAASGAAR